MAGGARAQGTREWAEQVRYFRAVAETIPGPTTGILQEYAARYNMLIQAGMARLLRVVGLPALVAAMPPEFRPDIGRSAGRPPPVTARAA